MHHREELEIHIIFIDILELFKQNVFHQSDVVLTEQVINA